MKKSYSPASAHKYGGAPRPWNLMDYFHPGAELLAKLLFKTPVKPEQVIAFGTMLGVFGGACFSQGLRGREFLVAGAVLLVLKNILDKTDGSLARARGETSRRGRFLDSLGDFAVSLATFAGISHYLALKFQNPWFYSYGVFALLSSLVQCTYFVHYQVSYVRRVLGKDTVNRVDERLSEQDRAETPETQSLQRAYLAIYGWQDALVRRLDRRYLRGVLGRYGLEENSPKAQQFEKLWYSHGLNLKIGSFLGLGTHIVLAAAAACLDRFDMYLVWATVAANYVMVNLFFLHVMSMGALADKIAKMKASPPKEEKKGRKRKKTKRK